MEDNRIFSQLEWKRLMFVKQLIEMGKLTEFPNISKYDVSKNKNNEEVKSENKKW